MKTRKLTLSSPIEEKIAWAVACSRNIGDRLREDRMVVRLLGRVSRAIQASRTRMTETGVSALCRQCEQEEGGSCCGAGMENRYDGTLLLMNLLLGCSLPEARMDPGSCYFLGEEGCVLRARHVICINYICRKITSRVDPAEIQALREVEGEEVNLVFCLHEHLKKALKELSA